MKIAISGASGYLGRQTVANLLRTNFPAADLILVTRDPSRLAAPDGAAVRAGDFSRRQGLPEAFAGAERLFMIAAAPDNLPDGIDQVTAHTAAIEAAVAGGVRHVVFQSSLAAAEDAPGRDEDDYRTEDILRRSGLAWTMLRTAAFADSRGREAKAQVQAGEVVTNAPDAPLHTVTRDDIATAAAAVLVMPPQAVEGRVFNLVSPPMTFREVAATLTEIAQRPVQLIALEDAAYRQALIDSGRPPRRADRQVAAGRLLRQHGQAMASDLPALLGRPGTTLVQLLRANVQELLTGAAPADREPQFL